MCREAEYDETLLFLFLEFIKRLNTSLPIFDVIADIQSALRSRHELVLEAPPGAGKTTQVPLALLHEPWLNGNQIIMLEPRRIAARAAAERMAELIGEPVGQTVGYRIRHDAKTSAQTRIVIVTEGILTRWLQQDPSLDGVGLVIFDEFHERNLESDVGLALCLQGRMLFRETTPLKLMAMSASLDGKGVARILDDAPIISSQGRSYPVDIIYSRYTCSPNAPITDAVCQAIQQALTDNSGNILVFLPGKGDIDRIYRHTIRLLENTEHSKTSVLRLFGSLSLHEQRSAIAPLDTAGPFKRKVVLATDIAETSLTIEGVNIVIDAGLSKVPAFDPKAGMTRLQTRRISKASSIQRAGRAGRLAPGTCYRLWPESTQTELADYAQPDILQADLAPFALNIIAWGVNHPSELLFINQPNDGAFQQAITLLTNLGAIETGESGNHQLTPHGQAMVKLPTHPRLAHMLIISLAHNALDDACVIAALLSERDISGQQHADFTLRMSMLNNKSLHDKKHRGWRDNIHKQSRSFFKLCKNINLHIATKDNIVTREDTLCFLLACAYPDRIARRQGQTGTLYKLSNGRLAELYEGDPLSTSEWLMVANLGGYAGASRDKIYTAAPFNHRLLDSHLKHLVIKDAQIEWDKTKQRFIAEQHHKVGALTFLKTSLNKIDAETKLNALIRFIQKEGLGVLNWGKAERQWQARLLLIREHDARYEWPDVRDSVLLNTIKTWLTPYLTDIHTLADFKQLPLLTILKSQIPWEQQHQVDALAPTHWPAASGSKIELDYRQSPPVLAVKLQEMFGCETTPTLVDSKVNVCVHLLSPARRPLQITQDLAHFWRTSYHDVKKEMKGRYPKLTGTLEGCHATGIMEVLTKPTRGFRNGYYKKEPNNDYSCHQACHC